MTRDSVISTETPWKPRVRRPEACDCSQGDRCLRIVRRSMKSHLSSCGSRMMNGPHEVLLRHLEDQADDVGSTGQLVFNKHSGWCHRSGDPRNCMGVSLAITGASHLPTGCEFRKLRFPGFRPKIGFLS